MFSQLLTNPLVLTTGLLAITATWATGCSGFPFAVQQGSGTAETLTIEGESFTRLDISHAVEVDVTIADGPAEASFTLDDNFIDDAIFEVVDGELRISMEDGMYDTTVGLRAEVTMASLEALDVTGASDVTVEGLAADDLDLDVTGASEVRIDGTAQAITARVSGASDVDLDALAVEEADLDVSGASDLDIASVGTATVDVSGAADLTIDAAGTVDGDASGASTLRIPDDAVGQISTSGAASLETS
ncbi:MAG: DUF2807 domain-containing protein [Actinomycetota bacterium]